MFGYIQTLYCLRAYINSCYISKYSTNWKRIKMLTDVKEITHYTLQDRNSSVSNVTPTLHNT